MVRAGSKGQVVIPVSVRRQLGKAGQSLAVRTGCGREVVLLPVEDGAPDVEDMLRRAWAWVTRTGRDLVEELHERRRAERTRAAGAGARRRHRSRPMENY